MGLDSPGVVKAPRLPHRPDSCESGRRTGVSGTDSDHEDFEDLLPFTLHKVVRDGNISKLVKDT